MNGKLILLFLCLVLSVESCRSSSGIKNEENRVINQKEYKKEVTGKIEVYDRDNVYLVMNWTSRSRVSLEVTGILKKEMKKLNEKIISAEGYVAYKTQWSGNIEIITYKILEMP